MQCSLLQRMPRTTALFEEHFGRLCSILLNEQVFALFSGQTRCKDSVNADSPLSRSGEASPWIVVSSGKFGEFAFRFSFPGRHPLASFRGILHIATALGSSTFRGASRFSRRSPLYEERYQIFGVGMPPTLLGEIRCRESLENRSHSSLAPIELLRRSLLAQSLAVGCDLSLQIPLAEQSVESDRFAGTLSLRSDCAPGIEFSGTLELRHEKYVFVISEEGCMKQQITDQAAEVKNLPVTIDLGALELSLQDLLELRPGSVIELPGAKSLEGLLKVAGAPWWKVRLEPQAEQLKVCIEEFFR